MTTGIEGIRLPSLPTHPRVQRKMPAPFTRPSLTVGDTPVKRDWRDIPAEDLSIGDTVPGIGTITMVHRQDRAPFTVSVEGGNANHRVFRHTDRVFAFTRA
jgi:hypothetical protein